MDSELPTAGEAQVRGGGGGSFGGRSKTTKSFTCTAEEVATALLVRKASSMVLTLFGLMLPKRTVKNSIPLCTFSR